MFFLEEVEARISSLNKLRDEILSIAESENNVFLFVNDRFDGERFVLFSIGKNVTWLNKDNMKDMLPLVDKLLSQKVTLVTINIDNIGKVDKKESFSVERKEVFLKRRMDSSMAFSKTKEEVEEYNAFMIDDKIIETDFSQTKFVKGEKAISRHTLYRFGKTVVNKNDTVVISEVYRKKGILRERDTVGYCLEGVEGVYKGSYFDKIPVKKRGDNARV